MGRPKTSMSFEEAREFIRTQCIGSRKQYQEWHKANKPKQIPRYPNRSYAEEWKGWNDFLGTNNKFDNTPKRYRPLAEAIAWVHKLGLTSQEQWFEYARTNRERIPEDIPTRPDVVYDDWRSWMHWLGSKPKETVEAQRQVIEQAAIYYIIQEREYANQRTVFTFGVEKGGVSALKDRWNMTKDFRVIKMFEYDEAEMANVKQLVQSQSTPYYGTEKIRICPNINQLVWDISSYLMIARND